MLNRREILKSLGLGAAACSIPGFAFANTDKRLVLVILRGAVDGLAMAAPYGDGNYGRVRGELAIPDPGESDGLLKLDGLFGLHPALDTIHTSYGRDEALVIHAAASPYRERSHFDGQDVLENGAGKVGALRDGWLNRALSGDNAAIALAQNTPLVLRGNAAVTSWAPSRLPDADDSTLRRLQNLYANDEFFRTRLEQALKSQAIASSAVDRDAAAPRGNEARRFGELMSAAARFLTAHDGPNIAVLEFGGWDTHANQGASTGALANRFRALDEGISQLQQGLGDAWRSTVLAIVTEFGRTVHVNGTRGTDHGTATAAVLVGGAVNGGKVIADWPGLADRNLYAGRDLMPTLDIRSVFKGLLEEHLEVPRGTLERQVFPDSESAAPLRNLVTV